MVFFVAVNFWFTGFSGLGIIFFKGGCLVWEWFLFVLILFLGLFFFFPQTGNY